MVENALKRLRDGAADCPSELDLDHLVSEELPEDAAARIAAHVADCASCQAKLKERRAHFDAFPDVAAGPLLAGIKQRLAAADAARQKRNRQRRFAYSASAMFAAAAALAVVVFSRSPAPGPNDASVSGDGIREKGGLSLRVYKWAGSRSIRAVNGDRFSSGERLRFVVDLPRPGHINILGIEASGSMYVAWPADKSESTLRSAGKEQTLPGAMALDESTGREAIYLVHCPDAVGIPASVCKAAGPGLPPACPKECAQESFVINKQ